MNDILKLCVCCTGVFVCYLFYGVYQERVTKGKYEDGEKFTYTATLVFVQCVTNSLFAAGALALNKKPTKNVPWYLFAMAAFTYVAAMMCSNMSLRFVSYPTQVLVKSCKPVAVLLLGILIAGKRYPLFRYLCVALIVSGAAIFLYPKDKPSAAKVEGNELMGNMLLAASLLFDGLTGALQEKTNAFGVSSHTLMLNLNMYSLIYLGSGMVYLGEVPKFMAFVSRNPAVIKDVLAFCVLSSLGQNFIFMTVTTFGSLVCSLVTTTRKFFTIVFSVILFGNRLVSHQWFGVALVFSGLFIEGMAKRNGSGKPAAAEKKTS
ncbi:solute carrier family 35 member B1-like [Sycon ciliatum]|uniref:solute carrier family 35 member B1-like n=1 Tax=Sycon ciliatum TaxID=27933 RepID=UPI0020AC8113|eukprot:scpid13657/ scgid21777/ Solute carrier family 35 member B1; UDP-galactose translocator 2; UDP-galactose transporter-related protein 1